ncbi:hypothetical protein [Klebsiella pneumoniae]|uniref:hypothetical protein n=1 Tax=Klebsiella pneumoniae TaxID=573 RepID=UPI003D36FC24
MFNLTLVLGSVRVGAKAGLSLPKLLSIFQEEIFPEKLCAQAMQWYTRGGAAPLTGLGIALIIERLVGLDGKPPVCPGLYFPYQVLDSSSYLARLEQEGGQVLKL